MLSGIAPADGRGGVVGEDAEVPLGLAAPLGVPAGLALGAPVCAGVAGVPGVSRGRCLRHHDARRRVGHLPRRPGDQHTDADRRGDQHHDPDDDQDQPAPRTERSRPVAARTGRVAARTTRAAGPVRLGLRSGRVAGRSGPPAPSRLTLLTRRTLSWWVLAWWVLARRVLAGWVLTGRPRPLRRALVLGMRIRGCREAVPRGGLWRRAQSSRSRTVRHGSRSLGPRRQGRRRTAGPDRHGRVAPGTLIRHGLLRLGVVGRGEVVEDQVIGHRLFRAGGGWFGRLLALDRGCPDDRGGRDHRRIRGRFLLNRRRLLERRRRLGGRHRFRGRLGRRGGFRGWPDHRRGRDDRRHSDHRGRRLHRFGLDRCRRHLVRGMPGGHRQGGHPGHHPTRLRRQQQADGHVVLRVRAQGRRPLEFLLQQVPDDRHPAAATDQHDRREVGRPDSGTSQHPGRHGDALPDGGPDQRLELSSTQPNLRRIARQRHGDRRLRFGRQVLLGLGAPAAHLGQPGPGLRIVGFQIAAAITEPAQHQPEDRLVEVGPGRVLGAFGLADGLDPGRRPLQHGHLAGPATEVVHRDPGAVGQRVAGRVGGGGRFGLGAAAYRAEVGGRDRPVEALQLVLAPSSRIADHRLGGGPALLRGGAIPDETENGRGRLLGGHLTAADHQGHVGSELTPRVDDQPRRIGATPGRRGIAHQHPVVSVEVQHRPHLRGVDAQADHLHRGTVDRDGRDGVRRTEVDP